MIKKESDCCDCQLPCIDSACPYYEVIRYYCDNCGSEDDDLYYYDGDQLCATCILQQLRPVEHED